MPPSIAQLMHLNVPKDGPWLVSAFMTRQRGLYPVATALPLAQPIPSCDHFTDTSKEWVKPVALEPTVSVADPLTNGRSWPLQS